MSVSTTTVRTTYSGNGATTAFSTVFAYLADDDVVVTLTVDDVDEVQALTTDYTLAKSTPGSASSTGTVTMLTAPPSGSTLTIERDLDLTQLSNLRVAGSFSPAVHENAFDRVTMGLQQVRAEVLEEVEAVQAALQAEIDILSGGGLTVTVTPTADSVPLADGSGKLAAGWLPANLVTLAGSQTLTNKTLTSPTLTSPTISSATISSSTLTSATITSPAITTPTINFAAGGSMTVPAWTSMAYENSWTGSASYRKLPNGIVHLTGQVAGGTSGGARIATLPVGYRPPVMQFFPVLTGFGAGIVYVTIGTDGGIDPYDAGGVNVDTTQVTFYGIFFET